MNSFKGKVEIDSDLLKESLQCFLSWQLLHIVFFVNQCETLITFLFSKICKNFKLGCPKRACHISELTPEDFISILASTCSPPLSAYRPSYL